MKPKILKIIGINSFNEEQIIDFSNLLSKGIFGIFGDTGSGKSTIIDCITLALYGKIVRHRNKNGDFININRNDAKVEFEFSIKDGTIRKNYYILRQFKREKEGNIVSKVARLIDLEKNEILADKIKEIQAEIENIIGLNYEDFIKAVILPQGKFSEFLMLENAEKRKMLERIFGLEKYGEKLNKKINDKKKEKKDELDKINEKISIYSEITEDTLKEKINLLEETTNFFKTNQKKIEKILEEIKILEKNIELKEKYIENFEKQQELLKYKEMVDNFKIELENSKRCNIIKPFLIEIFDIRKRKIEIEEEFLILKIKNEDLAKKYLEQQEKYKKIDFKFKNEIPKLNEKSIYLKNCIDLENECKKLELEIFAINENTSEINKKYNKIQKEKQISEEEKEDIEKNIENLQVFKEKNKIDKALKENLEKSIILEKEKNNIENSIQENKKIIEDIEKNIKEDLKKIEQNNININKIEEEKINILITNKLDLKYKLKNALAEEKKLDKHIEETKQKIFSIDTSLKLQQNKEFVKGLVEKLEEGVPCPICGSENHPNPAKIFLEIITESLEENKNNFNKDIEKLNLEKIHISKNQVIFNKKLQILEKELENFNLKNFEEKIIDSYIFENLDEILNEKNNYILNLKQENIIFKTNIKNRQQNIFNTEEKTKCLEDSIKKINENIKNIKIQFNFQNIDLEYEKILKIEKELENVESKIMQFTNNLKKRAYNLEKLQLEFIECEKIITKNETLLKEKNINLAEKKGKLSEKKYEKNFVELLKEIENEISLIIKQEKIEKNEFEKISLEKSNTEGSFNKISTEKEINEKIYNEKTNNIKKMLEEIGFLEEEILEKALPKEKEDFRKEKVESYEEKTNACKINLENIKNQFFEFSKNNIEDLDLSYFKNSLYNILKQKEYFEKEKENNMKNIAELKIQIENGEKALEKTKVLQEKKVKVQKKYDILEELFKLNQGGIFVEYVANSQLKQIVFDASKRLEIMSQNKYSLELIDNEFTIKDNYNGGILRSTRSLSGGEVFMASLSLALSLSSKIQLKNKSPLEVFFLDEGFGTLDNNLLDTVINTLEQLQNENIDVGIITHVEEIKNRVYSKITVENKITGAKIIFN